MIYLVSYDLKEPGKDYSSLYNALKSADSWWHYLESTWLLFTKEDVNVWSAKIKAAIDSNDSFIIVNITKMSRQGWLPQKAWDWIRDNENK